ncbi:hypothetical protein LEP1GSC103_2332 [Leptospira borgpetersenii serovar Javanica str. UI 09931]|uniref:Uncharacterized protein n=1 Tax=Leptospira borgpetersenii serovar Javanica str. UI 09931 TaxID=1049767 RepID=A0AAV3JAS9_LEPBO|nr:hypothetical protein LEP1GSC101_1839 [Leptospira borgpetersenii str. UI 09149]EMO07633.1 hypothetical protein LEP1GSC137_1063 [Leptospira borgpetersenii str. Noumea 25]EPG57349.1 hypothetical protein LEP1GSC103_2332 [Leptospira borgpetersenii serovar Javanica str. UI 09931]
MNHLHYSEFNGSVLLKTSLRMGSYFSFDLGKKSKFPSFFHI